MSTSNTCCSDYSENGCDIAKTDVCPDCFKLRIEYDPSIPSYALALCNSIVTFSNQCCLSGAGSVILRIPMVFSQNCTLYRLVVPDIAALAPTVNPFSITVYDAITNDVVPVLYVIENGFLNIIIPSTAISFGQVTTIVFASFLIPVRKLSGLAPPNSPVTWVLGINTEISSTTTTIPTTLT
jgi:hypothetical protein